MEDLLVGDALGVFPLSLELLDGLDEVGVFVEDFLDLGWVGRRGTETTSSPWPKSTH
jgi:hypothetical protein